MEVWQGTPTMDKKTELTEKRAGDRLVSGKRTREAFLLRMEWSRAPASQVLLTAGCSLFCLSFALSEHQFPT